MRNNRALWFSLAGAAAVAMLMVSHGASAQLAIPVPAGVPEPMPAPTPHLRQVTVGRVTGTLRRDTVRMQAARSWAAIAACVQNSGSRAARVSIRFVVVLGRSPEVVLIRAPAGARSCVAQEISSWRFGSDAGIGTAAVTFRTRGIDAAVAGAASRTPVPRGVLQGAGQIVETGQQILGTQ